MAKFDLKFLDAKDDSWVKCGVGVHKDTSNLIVLKIYNPYTLDITDIYLDKSTAIKFAKTLRTEINKIQ